MTVHCLCGQVHTDGGWPVGTYTRQPFRRSGKCHSAFAEHETGNRAGGGNSPARREPVDLIAKSDPVTGGGEGLLHVGAYGRDDILVALPGLIRGGA
jgi:hypothetical protein